MHVTLRPLSITAGWAFWMHVHVKHGQRPAVRPSEPHGRYTSKMRAMISERRQEEEVVGAEGFEPTTPASQTLCATRLRYAPTQL